jgi:hypothetical protein
MEDRASGGDPPGLTDRGGEAFEDEEGAADWA